MHRSPFRSALATIGAIALSSALLTGCDDPSGTTPSNKTPPDTGPLGDLLPVDDRIGIEGLEGPVDIVRDTFGRPHIYATSVNDALRVEGYLVASDRTLQLEFFRRISEGRMAEMLADSDKTLIDLDITYRHIGLHRVAKAQYDGLPPGEMKDALDAFADGVTQVFRKIRSKEIKLPEGIIAIPIEAFTDWTGADSLAIGRLQTHLLSFDADADISNQLALDAARATFPAGDPDPLVAGRAGFERDFLRFAPADPATTTTGYPMGAKATSGHLGNKGSPAKPRMHKPSLGGLSAGYLDAMRRSRELLNPDGFGSNNWAIAPERSATGHAMVASDPHLPLNAPSIFWPVSLDVKASKGGDASQDLSVSGVAFPGIPGIILGHNAHIAWGATVAGYDVSDAYAEELTDDGTAVVFNGQKVALETIEEVIQIQSKEPYTYKVQVVPHHGPLLPVIKPDHTVAPLDPKQGAISIRWTGLEATREVEAVFSLLRAKDVDEARAALSLFGVGAQNWMLADTSGSILWTSHANVPVRDKPAFQWDPATYSGTLPCFVLPGDGTAEWKGYLPDDSVPWEKDPAKGYLATANNDPIGDTLDNDPSNDTLPDGTPMFTHCAFDIGFREGRIKQRLEGHPEPLSTADLSEIQADTRSAMGAALAPLLVDALARAREEKTTPGTHLELTAVVSDPAFVVSTIKAVGDSLEAWGTLADYDASSGVNPDDNTPLAASDAATEVAAAQATLLFNTWLGRMLHRTFGDELAHMGYSKGIASFGREVLSKSLLHLTKVDPATLATFDPATGDSAIWDDMDTPEVESRQDRMVRAMLDALADLNTLAGPDLATYRWGLHHTVRLQALISIFGSLSIPPTSDAVFTSGFPRHGDWFSVDSSDHKVFGPTAPPAFGYAHGPSQRFVIEMDPAGPKAFNAIPGGNVWDATSKHFADEAELWRRNQTHPVPFLVDDVIAANEKHTLASAPQQ